MTAPKFSLFDIAAVEPEHDEPDSGRLISGAPKFRTWNLEDRDGKLFAGVWEATPGKWHIAYDEWEFVHVLKGVSVITDESGDARTVKAGDSFIIRPGFKGTWEVIETTLKEYVITV